jgi:hypothetical protein
MKRAVLFLLCVSLGANAWMLWGRAHRGAARAMSGAAPKSAGVPVSAARSFALSLPIAGLEATDAAAMAEALRAAGVDDVTLRAVMEGALRRRHREKLAAVRSEREKNTWWRNGRTAQEGDAALSQEMVAGPLERVLGRDPLEVAAAESRYSFLAPATQRKLAQIDLDYADLLRASFVSATTARLRAEADEQRLVTEEKRKDVLAALTPEERAEYDLRFSATAGTLSQHAVLMGVTEAEYRALKSVLDDFDAKSKALPRGETFSAAYEDVQRAATKQMVDALGYERAIDYVWSGYASYYGPMRSAVAAGEISADVPGRVMNLTADTGRRAAEVHADATLTLDQKKAALVTLQQTAQAQLDTLLPKAVQRNLPPEALRWLSELGAGRYLVMQPSLLSSGGNIGGMLTGAPVKRGYPPAMPVKPAGK